jgi:hypothetical protein
MRKHITNGLLIVASTCIALLGAELALRWFYPIAIANFGAALEGARDDGTEVMVPDETLGLRPALGTRAYDKNGIYFSRSIHSKASEPYRILFLGDSVVERARMVRALGELLGSENTTYLNGGVGAYNIAQEVEFFFRYQKNVRPDAIVHVWHINDLQALRTAYRNRDGTLNIHSPKSDPEKVNPWLYRHSQLYRFVIFRLRAKPDQDELRAQASASLQTLRDYARANGIAYYAVLFPVLLPMAKWTAYDRMSRASFVDMSEKLELGLVDLQPVAESMLERRVDPSETPGDIWHPNERFAEEAAKYIVQKIPALANLKQVRAKTASP